MECIILNKTKAEEFNVVELKEGLKLYCFDKDGDVIVANYNGDSFDITYPDGMILISEKLAPLSWYSYQQIVEVTLRKKFLGFDTDKITSYCQSSYDIGINPLPELRKKFCQHEWSFSCTINAAEKGITVHLVDGLVSLSWGSDCFKRNNQTINKIFKSEER